VSQINWNLPGERFFEAGVDRGVLYPKFGPGVPWNGLISVAEVISGGEVEPLYFNGIKYRDLVSAEDFQATIEAYAAPAEFAACDGQKTLSPGLFATQQPRQTFGLCYRTGLGNDLQGTDYGYKLHLVYNCTAEPSGRTHQTTTATANASPRSWTINTVPPAASTFRPTAHLVIDSTLMDPYLLSEIEQILYGRDASDGLAAASPYLPTVAEILSVLENPITELIEATI
jgi:hypothetical protein